jgi:hypothetical protein
MGVFKTFNVFTVPLEEAHKRRTTMIVGEGIENRDGTITIRFTSPLPFGFDGRLTLAERVAVAPSPSSPRPPAGSGTVQLSDRARAAAAAGRRLPTHEEQAAGIQRELDARGQTFTEALGQCDEVLLGVGTCELERGHAGEHAAKGKRWRDCQRDPQPGKAGGAA